MGKAKNQSSVDQRLAAGERQRLADFLAGTHDKLRLWRMCTRKACRRTRSCGADVDACATRCCPQRWAWVHCVVKMLGEGRSRRAAVRAADQAALGGEKRVRIHFGFGEPVELVMNSDGTWTRPSGPRARIELGTEFRRLTGAASAWLRSAPGGGVKGIDAARQPSGSKMQREAQAR